MEIIDFPGGAKRAITYTTNDPVIKMIVSGPISFTCPTCGENGRIDFQNIIFRQLEVYCKGCGSFHRITNPAFAPLPKLRK